MTKLKKNLNLFDIIAVCVGAMFSSGFFLLPGLAYVHTGPSIFLAYILSGLLILPAMLSKAELSTAMPKAGGTYFFLDRAFGPIMGTIGGFGSFIGLVLKTAFALIGFGAYLQLYFEVPIKYIALILAVLFIILNLLGAKESTKYQKILVSLLLFSLIIFIIDGFFIMLSMPSDLIQSNFTPFFSNGMSGFFYTTAFVFVSYAGLTKIASIAEEVKNPDKNIPLGMIISLVITMIIYGLGILVVVALVPGSELFSDLKPIATAEKYMFSWLKKPLGLVLITSAALAAFASTGNAGVLASSRYPLAMARDNLLPKFLTKMNAQRIPFISITITGLLIIIVILTQSEESIAKFASAFQLLLFLMINLSVIVMRESKITTYDPGFRSPFYPWTQLIGILVSISLIVYMGLDLLLILLLSISLFFLWYKVYAAKLVIRRGAIYHWFALLGSSQFDNLESELWYIMKDKGIRENDPVNYIINNADILDLDGEHTYKDLVEKAIALLSPFVGATSEEMELGFLQKAQLGAMPITKEICVSGLRFMDLSNFKLVVIRCKDGFSFHLKDVQGKKYSSQKGKLAFFLISPESEAAIHLRLIAHWIHSAENNFLVDRCMLAKSIKDIKDVLSLKQPQNIIIVTDSNTHKDWINKATKELPLKEDEIIVYITRNNKRFVPTANTVIQNNDVLFIVSNEEQNPYT